MVLERARRAVLDPYRRVQRLLRCGLRTGLIHLPSGRPLQIAKVAWQQGIGVRSMIALHAAAEPQRPAAADARRTLSYAELHAETEALASGLVSELGARRGDVVTMMMDNRVEYLVTWFALARLAVTCAHASRYSTVDELLPLLQRSGTGIIVVCDATLPVVQAALRREPGLRLRIVHVSDHAAGAGEATVDYEQLVQRHRGRHPALAPREAGSESVVYTSGTTGRPKGAVRDLQTMGVQALLEILERLPLHCGDRHLVVAPLYHSAAQAFVLINVALANTVVLHDKFDAEAVLRRLADDEIHNVFMVPTMIHRLLDLPDATFARHPTPALRALVSGAALFPTVLRQAAIERFGAAKIFDFYGATELGWVTLIDGTEMLRHGSSVGRAIPGQAIAIFDASGHPVPTGEIGTVYTRSVQMMRGYLDDPDATQASRLSHASAWATVEDLGYLDANGYLFVTGRARDMVISGGVNVYPVEIENVLAMHPAIRDVAVIGLPHPEWGETLTAVVVADDDFDADEATRWARSKLAPYKVPRRWERLAVLPRNPTGKVLKRALRDRLG